MAEYFYIIDNKGNFITRKGISNNLSLTDNYNFAYSYDSKNEANNVIKYLNKIEEFKGIKFKVISNKQLSGQVNILSSKKTTRLGCGGQCPPMGEQLGYIPGENKLFGKNSSVKIEKGLKKSYDTYIIYLSPYWSYNEYDNLCPSSSPGCRSTCLVTSGQLKNPAPKQSQLDKTAFWLNAPETFLMEAHKEILAAEKSFKSTGKKFCVRMNGTSDIPFEYKSYTFGGKKYKNIMEAFPNVQFYDYTKIYARLGKTPFNYHLTFSASETNTAQWKDALKRGFQVAMVFGALAPKTDKKTGQYKRKPGNIPTIYNGFKVVDGDETDLTFLQDPGVILGLRSKGKAENDITGFVKRDFDNSLKAKLNPTTNIPNIISPRSKVDNNPNVNIKIMAKLKKGSQAAKDYMAHIRSLKSSSSSVSGWQRGNTKFKEANERAYKGNVKVQRRKRVTSKSPGIKGSFLKLKTISGMSGIDKTIAGMQKKYLAIYQSKMQVISIAEFHASSLQEARKYAQAHKKHTPEFKKYKNITTSVKLTK